MYIGRVVEPKKAKWSDLSTFHSDSYLQFIRNYGNNELEDLSRDASEEAELYGVGELLSL